MASIPNHLGTDREVHIIVSTTSGSQSAQSFLDNTLLPYFSQNLKHFEFKKNLFVHTTRSPATIAFLTIRTFLPIARKGVKTTILLLSGDGGISDLVNALASTLQREIDDTRPPSIFFKPIVVLFPLGTANALAHSAGIVGRGEDGMKALMEGRARALPMFEVKFRRGSRIVADEGRKRVELLWAGEQGMAQKLKDIDGGSGDNSGVGELGYYDPEGDVRIYGCVVFSWGLHASLVALSDTAEMRKHGVERFKMAAGQLLEEGHEYSGTVKFKAGGSNQWRTLNYKEEGQDASTKHKYILATQVSNLEEKFCISPESKPMDGSLRLLAIGDESSEKVTKVLMLAYEQGKHVEECQDILKYQSIESLRIEFNEPEEKWRQICVDGKIIAIEEGGWVEVRKMPAGGVDGRRVVELVG